jgi:hypothetical protein
MFLVDFMSEHGQEFNGNVLTSSPESEQIAARLRGGIAAH